MEQSNSNTNEATSSQNQFTRKLVCVNYPGIVENVDNMIETLGGLSEIENAVSQKGRNLELRFRTKDKFCKPAVSDQDKKTGILVKITKKETRGSGEPSYDYEVVGVNALSYSFNKACDFQYLPLVVNGTESKDTPAQYIYNDIVPDKLPEENWIANDNLKDMPFYLPAPIFSRSDHLQTGVYFDRSKFLDKNSKQSEGSSRPRSLGPVMGKAAPAAALYIFDDPEPPKAPPPLALQIVNMRVSMKNTYEKLMKLFETRPIWSRMSVLGVTKIRREQVKFVLPAVACFCKSGPWRSMWVRFGYDPKREPEARVYQTFDFRVRSAFGLKEAVNVKRKQVQAEKQSLDQIADVGEEFSVVNENCYMLKPGLLPPARQMFYQYCEIQLPEIQSMLSRLPPVLPGTKCHYKEGWLPDKFADHCRDIVNKYVEDEVHKQLVENKKQNPAAPSTSGTSDNIDSNIEMMEIGDSDSDDSDYDLYVGSENSDEETAIDANSKTQDNSDSEDDESFNKKVVDDVAGLIGRYGEKKSTESG